MVLDSSRHLRQQNPSNGFYDNLGLGKDFLRMVVDTLVIGPDFARVGAMVFSNSTRLVFSLAQYSSAMEIKEALLGIPYMLQDTDIAQAMAHIDDMCFNAQDAREDARKVVVMVTSGIQTNPTVQDEQAVSLAADLREAGVTIIPVGITSTINLNLLRSLSSPPNREGEDFFLTMDFTTLDRVSRRLKECNNDDNSDDGE